ncbi:hypothetical protein NLG97_g4284 [Lecanicillium saksenae]|uniref:Uncharacterized protein n=1 Tax=Lecanicillium saksenae TaxID=468837 RepID=A0ACC1QVQ6_9HYPO|nr:hypothetical protein NLG97_g4284 [Lecanicillium saksenae]
MSSMRNAVDRRVHRERAQPLERRRLGLLEKHKDYSKRAADYNKKKAQLKSLRAKAAERNEDEFYFGMMSRKGPGARIKVGKSWSGTVQGDRGNKVLDMDTSRLLKTQDMGYIRTMKQVATKEVAKLEEQIVMTRGMDRLDEDEDDEGPDSDDFDSDEDEPARKPSKPKAARKIRFFDDEEAQEDAMEQHLELEEQEFEKDESNDKAEDDEETEREKSLRRLRRQLENARKKLKALTEAEEALEVQRAKMAKTATSGGSTRRGKKIMVLQYFDRTHLNNTRKIAVNIQIMHLNMPLVSLIPARTKNGNLSSFSFSLVLFLLLVRTRVLPPFARLPSWLSKSISNSSIGRRCFLSSLRPLSRLKRPFWPANHALAPNAASCPKSITPVCLQKMYGFSQGSLSDPSNNLGIYEEAGEQFIQSDLTKFYNKYASWVPGSTAPKNAPINDQTGTQDSGEADLDYEMAVPIIYPQGTTNYEVGEPSDALSFIDPLLEGLDGSYCNDSGECGKYKATNVISISYGDDEADYTPAYLKSRCNEWMKLGLQGVSVLISSGDSGIASRERNCLGPSRKAFVPGSLVSCPYVTAVGATQLPAGSNPGDAETATMEAFSSGGGFSNVITAPDYQKDALATYFSQHDPGYKSYNTTDGTIPSSGIYNRIGRGYPDVSANGLYGVVVVNGREGTSGGTSQSAPIFAALVTRIINERIKAGKKGPLGFLNPVLYQNPGMFNDIVSGDQHLGGPNGDGQPSACGNKGFSAVKGWDPVTGLGTPNYPKLLSVLKNV